MKTLLITIAAFITLAATIAVLVFIYLFDMAPAEIISTLQSRGKLFLYKHELVTRLSSPEIKQLYQNTCTRTCHSSGLIEENPRTAAEWDSIVKRMKAPDRADLPDHAAAAITQYLQNNFLSNIPTVLPEKSMRFVRRHLWKSDFGESDLYLDIIYIPRHHINLLPYLVASREAPEKQGEVFIVYLNTHQGSIPPWNLVNMTVLNRHGEAPKKAIDWKVIYEDGQYHHRQGLLIFPAFAHNNDTALEVSIDLPGMRKRVFQWDMPVPAEIE